MITFHGAIYLARIALRATIQWRALRCRLLRRAAGAGLCRRRGLAVDGDPRLYDPVGGRWRGPANPLAKTVVREAGAWFANYRRYRPRCAAVLGFAGVIAAQARLRAHDGAFWASSLAIAGRDRHRRGGDVPPSSCPRRSTPTLSLTVWDSVSTSDPRHHVLGDADLHAHHHPV